MDERSEEGGTRLSLTSRHAWAASGLETGYVKQQPSYDAKCTFGLHYSLRHSVTHILASIQKRRDSGCGEKKVVEKEEYC